MAGRLLVAAAGQVRVGRQALKRADGVRPIVVPRPHEPFDALDNVPASTAVLRLLHRGAARLVEGGHGLHGTDGQGEHVQPSRILTEERRVLQKLARAAQVPGPTGRTPVARIAGGVLGLPGARAVADPSDGVHARAEIDDGELERRRPRDRELGAASTLHLGRGVAHMDKQVPCVHIAVEGDLVIQFGEGRRQLHEQGARGEDRFQQRQEVGFQLVGPAGDIARVRGTAGVRDRGALFLHLG
mmetsp:Transcript_111787/g.321165  ORF Transcript_111787/g.321165 Transcript_111787/m.321165 type:complete len:243 (+) Transcript_111787:320-1048(+)